MRKFTLKEYRDQQERIENDNRYPHAMKAWMLTELNKTFEEINGISVIEYAASIDLTKKSDHIDPA